VVEARDGQLNAPVHAMEVLGLGSSTGGSAGDYDKKALDVDVGYLWGTMGIYELRDNLTVPNGDGYSSDRSQWHWQLENTSLTSATSAEYVASLAGTGRFVGRLEVQGGAGAPWGTVCSTGLTNLGATAMNLCASLNLKSSPSTLLPFYEYGSGVIYLADVGCVDGLITNVPQSSTTSSCEYTFSSKYRKVNNCSHVSDVGVFCGSVSAEADNGFTLAVVSVVPFSQMGNSTASTHALLSCLQRVASIPPDRVLPMVYAWTDATTFTLNFTFSTAPDSSAFTSGDLAMMLQLTNMYALSTECGVTEIRSNVNPSGTRPPTTAVPPTAVSPTAVPQATTSAPQTTETRSEVLFLTNSTITAVNLSITIQAKLRLASAPLVVSSVMLNGSARETTLSFASSNASMSAIALVRAGELPGVLSAAPMASPAPAPTPSTSNTVIIVVTVLASVLLVGAVIQLIRNLHRVAAARARLRRLEELDSGASARGSGTMEEMLMHQEYEKDSE
jgi:hypothetical protein